MEDLSTNNHIKLRSRQTTSEMFYRNTTKCEKMWEVSKVQSAGRFI